MFVLTVIHYPTQDNTFDIGSADFFNDIYAETLQGSPVLAENLTIVGNIGDILTYNGSAWVAVSQENTGSGSGGGDSLPTNTKSVRYNTFYLRR